MMTPEGAVKKRTKDLLAKYNCYQYWPVSNGMGAPALDCEGWVNGRPFAIECKAPGKRPTPRQEVTMERMRAAGAAVFVVDGSDLSVIALEVWLQNV